MTAQPGLTHDALKLYPCGNSGRQRVKRTLSSLTQRKMTGVSCPRSTMTGCSLAYGFQPRIVQSRLPVMSRLLAGLKSITDTPCPPTHADKHSKQSGRSLPQKDRHSMPKFPQQAITHYSLEDSNVRCDDHYNVAGSVRHSWHCRTVHYSTKPRSL